MRKTRNTLIVSIILLSAITVPGWAGSLIAWGFDSCDLACNVPAGDDFVAVSAGYGHSVAIKSDGSLVAWGYNGPDGFTGAVSDTPTDNGYVAVAAGFFHNVALKSDGSLVSWGSDWGGEVSATPAGNDFVAVAAGTFHSVALKSDGSLAAWGTDMGYFGSSDKVSGTPTSNDFAAISSSWDYNIAIKSDGSLVAWGNTGTPPAGNDFVAVAAGVTHNLALKSDGSLVAWGYDHYGEVNDTPAGNDFVAVAVGFVISVALKSNGSLVAWGYDDYGMVSNTPEGNGFVAVSFGHDHGVALYEPPPPPPTIESVTDFKPDVLNLQSPRKFVTVYIELPEGFNVSDIDISSLKLNDSVQALKRPFKIGDYDRDGIADLQVRFDRRQIIEILDVGTQMLTLTGQLSDGTLLVGTYFILMIDGAIQPESESVAMEDFITNMEGNLQKTADESANNEENVLGIKEAVVFMLYEANEIIGELGPESFSNEESASELTCALNDVFIMLDEGLYFESLTFIENDIIQRIDGCANIGRPDENDWITKVEDQTILYQLLTDTIKLLESML